MIKKSKEDKEMRYTTDNHPFNIANDRVRQWVEKTGKADWKAEFKAV